jgi:hypothetical protein
VAYSDLDDADGTGGTFATIIGIDLPKPHTFTAQQLGFNHSTLLSFNGRVAVRKSPCLEPLLYETDHFTKAGFGQTWENLRKKAFTAETDCKRWHPRHRTRRPQALREG